MPSGIDYSKWDKFAELSSSDEEIQSETSPEPRVIRLDEPGQVTRSPDGALSFSPSSKVNTKTTSNEQTTSKILPEKSSEIKNTAAKELLTKNGGECRDEKTQSYVQWSQDRYVITFRIYVNPEQVSRKNVKVTVNGIVPFEQRFSAVSSTIGNVSMTVKAGSKVLLHGDLPHFVHLPEDADPDWESNIDWEINERPTQMDCPPLEQNETKLIQFDLLKSSPMEGVQIWWSQPLKHFPSIDVNQIKERKASSTDQTKQTFKDVWDEAHKMFQQKKYQGSLHS